MSCNNKVKNLSKIKSKKGQEGMSLIETIPLVLVLATLLTFLLGFWGITHRHVLHSIAARTYAFETFRNRANLMYFIDQGNDAGNQYSRTLHRYHAIRGASSTDNFIAASMPIRYPTSDTASNEPNVHTNEIWQPGRIPTEGRAQVSANPVWIMVGYGICLSAGCGE